MILQSSISFSAIETNSINISRSLVIPIYGNEENIDELVLAVSDLNLRSSKAIEIVFVVDGSPDRSAELLLAQESKFNFPYQIIFHSRNFGSFAAIRTGLEYARGELSAVMAADLQEPPELIAAFFSVLENDEADVVFGVRTDRNDGWLRDLLSSSFWWLYRKLVIREVPRGGVDLFACNRVVRDAVLDIHEPNSSLIAQLFWVGFRRKFTPYLRRQRVRGKSSWNFTRRMRYMMDSIFSFSDLPILLVLWLGLIGCLLSFLFGVWIAIARLVGLIESPGYAALVVLITFSVSTILAVQGIIGSYLWRTFENTKRRPLRIVSFVKQSPPCDADALNPSPV